MLINLKLENFVLIEIIEINFEKGLNIFTGDSGSGKSLILDSLNVLFGGNNIPLNHLIRPGKKTCLIEANFFVNLKVKNWLIKNGIQNNSSEILISRKSYKSNNKISTKFAVNKIAISKQKLESLGVLLIDFVGQTDSTIFESQENRKQIIDDLGSKKLEEINLEVKSNWEELTVLKQQELKEIELFNKQKEKNFAQEKMLRILEEANLESCDEIMHLKTRESKLANALEIRDSVGSTLKNLIGYGKEDFTVESLLNISIKQLNRIEKFDIEIQNLRNILINIHNDFENLVCSLTSYLDQIEDEDISLDDIQSRLFFLRNLETTFSLNLTELINKRDQLKENIALNSNDGKIKNLKIRIQELTANLDNFFKLQTSYRKKIALELQESVMSVLNYLCLENAKFSIEFEKVKPSQNGLDNINFLFSANPDQQLAPIYKVISGGEMSRFLLAIKSTIAKNSGSFFLDEIDSGLSGKSLYTLVELIKKISVKRQVLCITHQPFLAAAANVHFKVTKNVVGGTTYTSVSKLSTKSERQAELTELIGGGFDEANDYASILIKKAAA